MDDTKRLIATFLDSLERRDWPGFEAILDHEVVYEMPQSRERIRGRQGYVQFNRDYPGDWHLSPHRIIAEDDAGVAWFSWTLDGETGDGIAFFSVVEGRITSVTDFWPEPFEPRPGREHLVERW